MDFWLVSAMTAQKIMYVVDLTFNSREIVDMYTFIKKKLKRCDSNTFYDSLCRAFG